MSRNKDSAVLTVSHRALLEELARRVVDGWSPESEDQEYFADLVFNLLANQRSVERAVRGQECGV